MVPNCFPHLVEHYKVAEDKPKKGPKGIPGAASIVGGGLLAGGAGTLAGYGAARGIRSLAKKVNKPLSRAGVLKAAPIVGALLGPAYAIYKINERREIERALKSKYNKS